jgi:hypothetical protein
VKDEVLVVVGYYGGYGGTFFANILRRCLEQDSQEIVAINDRNEFGFETTIIGSERYAINSLMKAYDKGFDSLFNVKFFEKMKDRRDHWGELIKKMFIDCYDNDRSVFCENLTNYLKKRLKLKPGFNVINAHYSRKHGGFSIYNVHDNVIFFLLGADDLKHHLLFDLMMDIKQKHFIYPEFVTVALDNLYWTPQKIKPFDSCHLLEVGRLFLQTKDNGLEEVERVISEAVGMKISLDKEMIEVYSKSNVKLLNEFLSIDIEEADYRDVLRAAEKKLKSLL